jgi:hypothetical protein
MQHIMLLITWENVFKLPSSRVLVVPVETNSLLFTKFHVYVVYGSSPACSKGSCDTLLEMESILPSSWTDNLYELNWQWWVGTWKVFKVVNWETFKDWTLLELKSPQQKKTAD